MMKSLLLTFLAVPTLLLGYFDGPYEQWREARVQAIEDFYGADFFKGKTLLEVGCGYGDVGAHFEKLGAIVTCSDAQSEYEAIIRARYPNVDFKAADFQGPWPLDDHYDIIIHMGVLNRMHNPSYTISQACQHCTHLILEADCINSFDPNAIQYRQLANHDFNGGLGSFVSPAYVERCLNDFGFMRWMIPDGRCNSGYWYYDSPLTNTGSYNVPGYRRMWFCQKCNTNEQPVEVSLGLD
ncbi:MAG: class I SAM-dependent methyltransferase [Chlamydiales bacterium]|nr:class I SAM-dependent methyltransferase [Chlamydiales bacterium]